MFNYENIRYSLKLFVIFTGEEILIKKYFVLFIFIHKKNQNYQILYRVIIYLLIIIIIILI